MRWLAALLGLVMMVMAGCRSSDDPAADAPAAPVALLNETAEVAGVIVPPEGSEPFGIMIYAEGTSHIAMTDREGAFVLSGIEPGAYLLRATRANLQDTVVADLLVTREDLDKPQPYLDLDPIAMLPAPTRRGAAGAFAIEDWGQVRGLVLTVNPADQQGVLVEIPGTGLRTFTDSAGAYVISQVPPGAYQVTFSQDGYTTTNVGVTVSTGESSELPDVQLLFADPSAGSSRRIAGTVRATDATGTSLPLPEGVTVILEGTALSVPTDAQGAYALSGLDARAYVVTARAPGFEVQQKYRVDLTELAVANVDLVLRAQPPTTDEPGTIIGQVTLAGGDSESWAGILVSVAGTSAVATTDNAGTYVLSNVPAGNHAIVASLDGYEPGLLDGIDLAAGAVLEAPPLTLERQVIAPKVIGTSPRSGATDVTIANPTTIVILFDQSMNPATLYDAVSINPDAALTVLTAGEHPEAADDRIVVELAGHQRDGSPLRFDRRYTLTVASSAANFEGVTMEEDFSMTFTTGAAKVISSTPFDGQEDVVATPSRPLRVTFNVALDPDTVTGDAVRVRPQPTSGQPQVSAVTNRRTGWTTLTIAGGFAPETEYDITVDDKLRTVTGERISNLPYRFSFETIRLVEGRNFGSDRDIREQKRDERERR